MDSDAVWMEGPALSVWVYDSPKGAAAGRVRGNRVCRRGAVAGGVAGRVWWVGGAHRPRSGGPHIEWMTGGTPGSALGALLGRLLFPTRSGADHVHELAAALCGTGLDEEFLGELCDAFAPGASALLVLSREADFGEIQVVIERGVARGDVRLLYRALDEEQLRALQAVAERSTAPG